ncbi:MAG TPA: M48 family metalloprotease [Steroidobacteraceae bacterium]|nr:M48 family metalloprotease [Steroidobacteraceae bacterium]
MRAFVLILLAAFLNATTVAAAAEPSSPLTTDLPSAINSELPNLSSPADVMLSKRQQYELGYSVMLQMRQQHTVLDDPETDEYVQQIGQRLASQSADGGGYFHYIVLRSNQINSFAVSGGWVFIFTGVITASHTESELAAVMAHETAHITQNHIARKLEEAKKATITSLAAMLGTILLGALGGGGGQAIEGGIIASQGLAAQQQIDFTRSEEEEADRVGIQYLAAAGFDPEAMADFFERLMQEQGVQDSWVPAILVDHPVDSVRVADARARAAQYPPVPDTSSPDYHLIKARVRVLSAPGDEDIQRQYAQKIANGNHSLGTMYGDALALMQDNEAARALPILKELIARHGDLHLLYSALGQAQAQAGEMKQALATFQLAMRLFPRNVPVTIRYAQTLMTAGKNAEAHDVLLDLFNNVEPTPDQIELTARAASAAGDLGDAYYYMGEYQIDTGNLPLAARQYQLALATAHLTNVQRKRISARLREVRDYLASVHQRQRAE